MISFSVRCLGLTAMASLSGIICLAGCGTTRMSDTNRTATEQLLISTAVDQAINAMNFDVLADKDVYLDSQQIKDVTDSQYIISSLRQQLLAAGCILKENREAAVYIVEPRAGAVGTNHNEVMLGVRSISIPSMVPMAGSTSIPEIPFAKTTDQKGVAKIAVFAYNRQTGRSVWQSGTFQVVTSAKDTWVLGTGPFQRGSIYNGTRFAGSRILLPFVKERGDENGKGLPAPSNQSLTEGAIFPKSPLAVATTPSNTVSPSAAPVQTPLDTVTPVSANLERAPDSSVSSSSSNRSNTSTATSSGNVPHSSNNGSAPTIVDGMSGFDNLPASGLLRLPPLDKGSAK